MTDKPPVRMETLEGGKDGRRYSSSAGRNQQEIVNALLAELPDSGNCLEVAAGTGEHAVLAATKLPNWDWLPTDRDPEALASIAAWTAFAALPNLKPAAPLDLAEPWPCAKASLDAVFACNVMHISPISTTEALFRGATKHLKPNGMLLVYGPVFLPDEPAPEGNVAFDRDLRQQDPAYGVRHLDQLTELAALAGLDAPTVRRMPTNNVLLRLRRP